MSKPRQNIKFSSTPIFSVQAGTSTKTLTMSQCFERVVDGFVEDQTAIYSLLETISLSCTLIEATMKAKLRAINPVLTLRQFDPESIVIASKKHNKLIQKTKTSLADLPSAPATELLGRFILFFDCKEKRQLEKLMSIRNKIVHSAQDATVDKREVTLLLTKYVFVFLKKYISIRAALWDDVKKMSELAYSEFATIIIRQIVKARRRAGRMSAKGMSTAMSFTNDTSAAANELVCPACNKESMSIYVEEDYSPDDYSVRRSASCIVCELFLVEAEYVELMSAPDKYFLENRGIADWQEAITKADNLPESDYDGYEPDEDYYRAR